MIMMIDNDACVVAAELLLRFAVVQSGEVCVVIGKESRLC